MASRAATDEVMYNDKDPETGFVQLVDERWTEENGNFSHYEEESYASGKWMAVIWYRRKMCMSMERCVCMFVCVCVYVCAWVCVLYVCMCMNSMYTLWEIRNLQRFIINLWHFDKRTTTTGTTFWLTYMKDDPISLLEAY